MEENPRLPASTPVQSPPASPNDLFQPQFAFMQPQLFDMEHKAAPVPRPAAGDDAQRYVSGGRVCVLLRVRRLPRASGVGSRCGRAVPSQGAAKAAGKTLLWRCVCVRGCSASPQRPGVLSLPSPSFPPFSPPPWRSA